MAVVFTKIARLQDEQSQHLKKANSGYPEYMLELPITSYRRVSVACVVMQINSDNAGALHVIAQSRHRPSANNGGAAVMGPFTRVAYEITLTWGKIVHELQQVLRKMRQLSLW